MNPRNAAQRNLRDDVEVRVWNDRGEVILPLEVTVDVPPGVVEGEKGAWLTTSRTGQTMSALVSADNASRSRRGRLLQRHPGRGQPRLTARGGATQPPILSGSAGCAKPALSVGDCARARPRRTGTVSARHKKARGRRYSVRGFRSLTLIFSEEQPTPVRPFYFSKGVSRFTRPRDQSF
jgi:Molydopterin dinucleotide binding domain